MGIYYWFVDFTNKRYIDGQAAKRGEWKGSSFDQAMVVNYLMDNCNEEIEAKFVSDESGEWDMMLEHQYEDYTCDNIFSMFEDGYFNDNKKDIWLGQVKWILSKFVDNNKVSLYMIMANKTPEFMKQYKETICDNLNKSSGAN